MQIWCSCYVVRYLNSILQSHATACICVLQKKRDCGQSSSAALLRQWIMTGHLLVTPPCWQELWLWQERFSPRAEDMVRCGAVSHQMPHGLSEWQGVSPVPNPLLGNGVWIGLRVLRAAFFWQHGLPSHFSTCFLSPQLLPYLSLQPLWPPWRSSEMPSTHSPEGLCASYSHGNICMAPFLTAFKSLLKYDLPSVVLSHTLRRTGGSVHHSFNLVYFSSENFTAT